MNGYSSTVPIQKPVTPLDIFISQQKKYRIYYGPPHDWEVTDELILEWTEAVIQIFGVLSNKVMETERVTLDCDWSGTQLVKLAQWGRRAYKLVFNNQARKDLALYITEMQQGGLQAVAPTIHSNMILFPWEVLYQGEKNYKANDFWGFKYPLARVLTPGKTVWNYPGQQSLPLDMLFSLHHNLHLSHQKEWPQIKELIKLTDQGQCLLLGPQCLHTTDDEPRPENERLLTYLHHAQHNLLHFACHCTLGNNGAHSLLVSLIQDENNLESAEEIELNTYTFIDIEENKFRTKPLVFLNACQSAGGGDKLRTIFNLPALFIKHEAAAVIATACPVPDLFAAAFARVFYNKFLKERLTVGEALRKTRIYFWKEHHNPLGLAYGLYSPAHYRLVQLTDS